MEKVELLDRDLKIKASFRNSMLRKAEMFLYLMLILGFVFWRMHWPMAAAILILSLSSLSAVYFLGTTFLINRTSVRNFMNNHEDRPGRLGVVIGIIAGVGLSIAGVGLLFGIFQWLNWHFIITIATPLSIVLALVGAGFMAKKENVFGLPLMKRSVFFAVACFLVLLFHVEIEAERYGVLKPLFYDIHECLESEAVHCENDKEILRFSLGTLYQAQEIEADEKQSAMVKLDDLATKYGYTITWGGAHHVDYQPTALTKSD